MTTQERTRISKRTAKRVTLLRDVDGITHRFGCFTSGRTHIHKGHVLGNVNGHHGGIEVTTYDDGTVYLSLYTEQAGNESWANVPNDALHIEE